MKRSHRLLQFCILCSVIFVIPCAFASSNGVGIEQELVTASQEELSFWNDFGRSMNFIGNLLLILGGLCPILASQAVVDRSVFLKKWNGLVATLGAVSIAVFGLFHFPEQVLRTNEARLKLQTALRTYKIDSEFATNDPAARKSAIQALSREMAAAQGTFLGVSDSKKPNAQDTQ